MEVFQYQSKTWSPVYGSVLLKIEYTVQDFYSSIQVWAMVIHCAVMDTADSCS